MNARERDDAQERRAARDAERHRQVIRARIDAALARREQAVLERWRPRGDHDRGEDE